MGIGELGPVTGTPSTVTGEPLCPSTRVGVGVKATVRAVS